MPTDIIFIHGLKLQTIIGCLPWEKETLQTVIIDLDMHVDYSAAAQSDDIRQSIDYTEVADCIKIFLQTTSYELVETLAENLAQLLLSKFPITQITLKLNKPGAMVEALAVGVIISRAR